MHSICFIVIILLFCNALKLWNIEQKKPMKPLNLIIPLIYDIIKLYSTHVIIISPKPNSIHTLTPNLPTYSRSSQSLVWTSPWWTSTNAYTKTNARTAAPTIFVSMETTRPRLTRTGPLWWGSMPKSRQNAPAEQGTSPAWRLVRRDPSLATMRGCARINLGW